jgi:hypothetical protein
MILRQVLYYHGSRGSHNKVLPELLYVEGGGCGNYRAARSIRTHDTWYLAIRSFVEYDFTMVILFISKGEPEAMVS